MYSEIHEKMRLEIRAKCEAMGLAAAIGFEKNQTEPFTRMFLNEWIAEKQAQAQEAIIREQFRLAQESVDAAKDSAAVAKESTIIAREAAEASKKSAFWTMVAAIAAFTAAAIPLLQALGWLPK